MLSPSSLVIVNTRISRDSFIRFTWQMCCVARVAYRAATFDSFESPIGFQETIQHDGGHRACRHLHRLTASLEVVAQLITNVCSG